jgi:4-amino-4-deoxy-L-arabinose transferase-like glycosyltransferase
MNWKVGLISAFLLSVNVIAIDLSREARMYAFFQFFYLLSLYLFYKGFEAKRGKTYRFFKGRVILENIKPFYLILFMVALVIMFLCHEGTVMIILGISGYAVILGFLEFKKRDSEQKYLGKYLSMVIFLVVMSIVGYLILMSTDFGRQYLGLGIERDVLATNMGFNLDLIISSILYYWLFFLQHFPLEWCFATLGLVLIIIKRKKNGAFIFSALFIPPFFQLTFFHYEWLRAKYLFHLIPLFLVLSAFGIYELAKIFKAFEYLKIPENVKPRFAAFLLCTLLVFGGFTHSILATQRDKIASPYWREACEYVLINSKNDTSLISSVGIIPYFFLESDEYGLRPEYPEYTHKNITIYDRPYLRTREDFENFTRTHDNSWV